MPDKPLPPGEYCIYLRKSRKDLDLERTGGGDTLARHRETLLALAQRLGVNVTHIYEEVVSGDTIAERPKMQQLLDAVDQGAWRGVLVMEIPRLARGDTIDQGIVAQAFRLSGTLIITPDKTYHPEDEFDEEYMEFGLFMSRREYKMINRRIQRGRVFSVREGKWVSHKTPYGWRRVKLPREKGFTLEPDPDTAPIVSMMYDWASTPQPVPGGAAQPLKPPTIANRLNDMGVPSPAGVKWTPCAVRNILRNPVNAGWVRWGHRAGKKKVVNGEVKISRPRAAKEDIILVPGRHQPLISQEVFNAVQTYISGPSRPGPKQMETKNPLAGLIICGGCGHAMTRRPYQSGRQETLLCPQSYCHTVASDLAVVEAAVMDALRAWLCKFEVDYASAKDSLPADHDPAATLRPVLAQAEKSLAQLTAQEQRAYTLVEQGVYTPEIFLERSRAITAQQTALRQQIETVTAQIQELEYRAATQAQIIPAVRAVLDSYPLAKTPKEKNDLLRTVLEKAVYTKTRRERSKGGSDMTITLYPKLPTPPSSSSPQPTF